MNLLTPIAKDGIYSRYLCKCGTEKRIRTSCVNTGRTKSCGCLQRENIRKNRKGNCLSEDQIKEAVNHLSANCKISLIAYVMKLHPDTISKIKRKHFKTVRIDYIESLENQIKSLKNQLNTLRNEVSSTRSS